MSPSSSPPSSSPDLEGLLDISISTDIAPLPEIKAAGVSEVDFDGALATPLRLHEDLKNGCGGQLWPAGMVLAKYVLRRLGDLSGRTVLELGAGGGLVGLAVALGCKTTLPIHITDQLPMLDLMKRNIVLNSSSFPPSTTVEASIYDWGTSPPPTHLPTPPDIILAADCVYFEPAFPLLQQTLLDLIGENTVCYFCFKKRRRADLGFMKVVKKAFVVEEVKDDPDAETYRRESIFLYRITKKK